jgi:hypothetical protein
MTFFLCLFLKGRDILLLSRKKGYVFIFNFFLGLADLFGASRGSVRKDGCGMVNNRYSICKNICKKMCDKTKVRYYEKETTI